MLRETVRVAALVLHSCRRSLARHTLVHVIPHIPTARTEDDSAFLACPMRPVHVVISNPVARTKGLDAAAMAALVSRAAVERSQDVQRQS